MLGVLDDVESWRRAGKRVALATIVKVWGSAPRPLGSKMAVSDAGDISGSVSGGCVEGAVYEEAQGVLKRGEPKLAGYGVSDETAWSVGLSCGGRIEIFIAPVRADLFDAFHHAVRAGRLVALASVVAGPGLGRQLLVFADGSSAGDLGAEKLREPVVAVVGELFVSMAGERRTFEVDGGTVDVFIEIHPPPPKLVIVGAVHAAIPLVDFAKLLGFRTYVVDPRTAFATPERFARADELITDWPGEALAAIGLDEATYVALLSHDLKLDLPALEVALPSAARYVGALGSKKTHARRCAALREAGVAEELVERIHNPIGLPLGGRRAEEVALSIIAEIVAVSHGVGVKPPPS